jgi:hypothetical protein
MCFASAVQGNLAQPAAMLSKTAAAMHKVVPSQQLCFQATAMCTQDSNQQAGVTAPHTFNFTWGKKKIHSWQQARIFCLQHPHAK